METIPVDLKVVGIALTEREFGDAVKNGIISLARPCSPDTYMWIRMIRYGVFSVERLVEIKSSIEELDPNGNDRELHFIREEILSVFECPE